MEYKYTGYYIWEGTPLLKWKGLMVVDFEIDP